MWIKEGSAKNVVQNITITIGKLYTIIDYKRNKLHLHLVHFQQAARSSDFLNSFLQLFPACCVCETHRS